MKDIDAQTGIVETYKKDNLSGKIHVHKTQDVSPFLSANKQESNQNSSGFKAGWHKMASIPPIVLEMWREELKAKGYPDCNPLSAQNKQFLRMKLNSPDWAALRTKDGVI